MVISVTFAAGFAAGVKYDQSSILKLEQAIDLSNSKTADILRGAKAAADRTAAAQAVSAIQFEAEHSKNIELLAGNSAVLASARRMWASHQPSSDCAVPEASHPGIDKSADGGGFYLSAAELSEELDRLVQKKSFLADAIDADKHFILTWLNSLPPELIK
jgi:hypothetical protein